MILEDPTQPIRVVNLTLGIVVLTWLLARRRLNPDLYIGFRNDVWLMAVYWVIALLVGTTEQLFETGTSIRVLFSFLAIITTLRLLRRNPDWVGLRSKEKPS